MGYDALYGRQSVEKKDSISVESQIEYCRYETHGRPYLEYTDRGFSGKDTNRPGFEKMMRDVAQGKIERVIVYKLDRISRSILDFANMMEFFQKYQVEFISTTEKFDTSTPIGRAMLNICIVFAQLERETIQKRVTDAYYARSKKGFYMGGRVPYGYCLKETVIDHVRTSMYEEVAEESSQIRIMYSMYADPSHSLGDIARFLDDRRLRNRRGERWSSARISEILRNPVYVKADIDVYHFFKEQGIGIVNPVSEFIGNNGCYLYKRGTSPLKKQDELQKEEIVLAPHRGLVSSKEWIACRKRCLNNRCSTKTCKAKNSWLCGKLKCGNCGYGLTVRRSKTKWGRYFVCSRSGTSCKGTGCTVYADILEDYMAQAICTKLKEFRKLSVAGKAKEDGKDKEKEIRLARIEEEIDGLLSKVADADGPLIKYINVRVGRLEDEKVKLERELVSEGEESTKSSLEVEIPEGIWGQLSFEDKQAVMDVLVEQVRIAEGTAQIRWRV